jgi:hypothetical protein
MSPIPFIIKKTKNKFAIKIFFFLKKKKDEKKRKEKKAKRRGCESSNVQIFF